MENYCTSCWVPGSLQVARWGSCVPMENLIERKAGGWSAKKENRSNSCWELLLQGGETRWWSLRAWNLASVGRLVTPVFDESALRIPPAHTFSWHFGWALPQSIFKHFPWLDFNAIYLFKPNQTIPHKLNIPVGITLSHAEECKSSLNYIPWMVEKAGSCAEACWGITESFFHRLQKLH